MTDTTAARTPVWRHIVETLRSEILGGAYDFDEPIPPEMDIADRFSVSRMTARRALAALQDEGFLRIEQGRGTYIHKEVLSYQIGASTRFTQNLRKSNKVATRSLLEEHVGPADEQTAKALNLSAGAQVLRLTTLGNADGTVISIGKNYYDAERFQGLGKIVADVGSLSKALKQFGIGQYRRLSTRIVARMPTNTEAHLLRQPKTRPVVVTYAVDVELGGGPIYYGETCFCADRIEFTVD